MRLVTAGFDTGHIALDSAEFVELDPRGNPPYSPGRISGYQME
jgi:hypothetical protein